jgi:FlaA1/EpsC-like NDP-sugar epimerase
MMLKIFGSVIDVMNFRRFLGHIVLDSFILVVSFMSSLVLATTGPIVVIDGFIVIGLSVLVAVIVLLALGFYKIIISYITGLAAVPVFVAVCISSLVAAALATGLNFSLSLASIAIYSLLSLVGILGVRFGYRQLKSSSGRQDIPRILVYGAGAAGRQLVNSLSVAPEFSPVAFIDDRVTLQGRIVGGLKVFAPKAIEQLVDELHIDTVVLAIPSLNVGQRREIVIKLQHVGLQVRIMPGLSALISNSDDFVEMRSLSILDILGRDSVPPMPKLMTGTIAGKVVLVTGAGGSIGQELCRQIIQLKPTSLLLLDISEYSLYVVNKELTKTIIGLESTTKLISILGSVQDYSKMKAMLNEFSVDTIFHSAAYKHVPLVESNIVEGIKNNVFGTETLARAAVESNVGVFLLISTDKAVRPTNIMGASKRMAEFVCSRMTRANSSTIFSMVRFGNVLGSSGSVVPLFEEQIRKGGPVTVTHPEITRFFMSIPEAAQLVIQASSMAKGGEVYLLDMGEPVKISDLAVTMIKLGNMNPYFPQKTGMLGPKGSISIIYSGLRPGEKLYEELLVNDDSQETEHPLIKSAVEDGPDKLALDGFLVSLAEACESFDEDRIRQILIDAGTGLTSNGYEFGV